MNDTKWFVTRFIWMLSTIHINVCDNVLYAYQLKIWMWKRTIVLFSFIRNNKHNGNNTAMTTDLTFLFFSAVSNKELSPFPNDIDCAVLYINTLTHREICLRYIWLELRLNRNFFQKVYKQTKMTTNSCYSIVCRPSTPPSPLLRINLYIVKVRNNNNNCTAIFNIAHLIHRHTRARIRFPIFCYCNNSQFVCRLLIFLYLRGCCYCCWNCSCPKKEATTKNLRKKVTLVKKNVPTWMM